MATNLFKGKNILVTGGTGSIGSIIVKKLLKLNPRQIKVLSRDETKQYNLAQELNYNTRVRLLIGDIRNKRHPFSKSRDDDSIYPVDVPSDAVDLIIFFRHKTTRNG